jgi:glucokinase
MTGVPDDGLAIGLDAGGTKVLGVVADAAGAGRDRVLHEMPATEPVGSVDALLAVAGQLRDRNPGVAGIGVGAAGMVTLDGVMRFAPNVAWREFPLKRHLEDALGLPVTLDNDANVAAWGEFLYGAGRGASDLLVVTVGTGIGGAIVSDGRLIRGAHGFAGEIGHIIVEPNGPLCGCGNRGCWEQVAAGRAIDRLGREVAREHPESEIARLAGGDPDAVRGPIVAAAARSGDPIAIMVLAEVGRRLGEGIAGLVNVLDSGVVVVGGGAAMAGDLLLEPARRAMEHAIEGPTFRPPVAFRSSALGYEAGALGAAALALGVSPRSSHPVAAEPNA